MPNSSVDTNVYIFDKYAQYYFNLLYSIVSFDPLDQIQKVMCVNVHKCYVWPNITKLKATAILSVKKTQFICEVSDHCLQISQH